MTAITLSRRLAQPQELSALRSLMTASIEGRQKPFLTADQIASSRTIMGLDTQLIDDGPSSQSNANQANRTLP